VEFIARPKGRRPACLSTQITMPAYSLPVPGSARIAHRLAK